MAYENGNGNGNNGNGSNGNGNSKLGKLPFSIVSRFLNISSFEWPRVSECWFITFFFKIGSAIGWTILTAAFVSQFGIRFLPMLFVINALLVIGSTFFFEQLIMRMKREILMILMLLIGSFCLLFAALLYDRSMLAFFVAVIFAESVFFAQFNVFIPILVGDRFTPLESQRTFPVVESGETIGGMVGGAAVGIFASRLPIPLFLYAWIVLLVCAIAVFIIANSARSPLPPLPFRVIAEKTGSREKTVDQIRLVMKSIGKIPFLKGLVIIVFLQWIFMNVLEFQYTKAMEQSVTRKQEKTIALIDPELLRAAVLGSPERTRNIAETQALPESKRALTRAEQAKLTEKLGLWKGVFHFGALIVQALLASRLITALGVVGAMLLHPIVMLMSLVGMFLKFGFLSSIIARLNFETTLAVHKNAYFASHYAFPKFIRDQAAEFLEGIVRPLGTLVGMTLIAGFELFLDGRNLSLSIHLGMFLIMAAILMVNMRLQEKYTNLSRKQLFSDLPYPEKLNAVEILAQRGHDNAAVILVQKLHDMKEEPSLVKKKIIAELGKFRDYSLLPEILDLLSDPEPEVRLEAAHALMNFRDIGEKFYTQAFSRFRMIETLKEVFRKETSATVRKAIIQLFSLLNHPEVIPFLLGILKDEANENRADCIYTLGLFRDPNTAYYIFPYFQNETDPSLRANAIVALWQFPKYRENLQQALDSMLRNPDPKVYTAGIFAAGEVSGARREFLREFLHSSDPDAHREASFALTKCGDQEGFEMLLSEHLAGDSNEFETLRRFFHRLKPQVRNKIHHLLVNYISKELDELSRTFGGEALSKIPPDRLERLRRLYALADQHEELYMIEKALQQAAA